MSTLPYHTTVHPSVSYSTVSQYPTNGHNPSARTETRPNRYEHVQMQTIGLGFDRESLPGLNRNSCYTNPQMHRDDYTNPQMHRDDNNNNNNNNNNNDGPENNSRRNGYSFSGPSGWQMYASQSHQHWMVAAVVTALIVLGTLFASIFLPAVAPILLAVAALCAIPAVATTAMAIATTVSFTKFLP